MTRLGPFQLPLTLLACLLSLLLTSHAGATASESPTVRFIAFGDFGTGGKIQYQVAAAARKKCQQAGCDFVLTLGDNIYNNGVRSVDDPQFQSKFERPYADLPYRFYMVLGNHDYRGNINAEIDYTHKSSKWYLPARYYRFQVGPAQFLALDTNRPDPQQKQYFQTVLHQAKSPWKLAFGHHPRFTNGYYKDSQTRAQKELLDSLCGQVSLYLSGHEHNQQYLHKSNPQGCSMDYLILGSAGGMVPGASGPGTQFYRAGYGFGWFEISPEQIYFEILDENGHIRYRHAITKSAV